jgi:G3E family GTPase
LEEIKKKLEKSKKNTEKVNDIEQPNKNNNDILYKSIIINFNLLLLNKVHYEKNNFLKELDNILENINKFLKIQNNEENKVVKDEEIKHEKEEEEEEEEINEEEEEEEINEEENEEEEEEEEINEEIKEEIKKIKELIKEIKNIQEKGVYIKSNNYKNMMKIINYLREKEIGIIGFSIGEKIEENELKNIIILGKNEIENNLIIGYEIEDQFELYKEEKKNFIKKNENIFKKINEGQIFESFISEFNINIIFDNDLSSIFKKYLIFLEKLNSI